MGKTFGALALVFGLLSLLLGWAVIIFVPVYGTYLLYGMCGLAIIFGIIGIIKDDSKGMAIAGMILGIIALFIWGIFWALLFVILFAGLFGSLIP